LGYVESQKDGDGIQDQEFVSTNEANNHLDPGFADTFKRAVQASIGEPWIEVVVGLVCADELLVLDPISSFGGPTFPEPRINYPTQCYSPQIGLMVDEPPVGGFVHNSSWTVYCS
jgi:hypothetical protein